MLVYMVTCVHAHLTRSHVCSITRPYKPPYYTGSVHLSTHTIMISHTCSVSHCQEWQSTHPPYQLIPHTNSTPVHTWVDQLIPSPPTAITNSSPRPSIPYQLIPSHRPSVTNSSPTHDYIVGYLNCFKVRHTDSQRLLILWECNKTHLLLEAIYFI